MADEVNILETDPCVEVFLDQTSDDPVILLVAGPQGIPGPPGPGSLNSKAGVVPAINFTGSPQSYNVVFATPFTTDYAVAISGVDSRSYGYSNKTSTGFTINTHAATPIANEVSWIATAVGEAS